MRLIGLAGKKRSGKSELAKYTCTLDEKAVIVTFATPLKMLCTNLLNKSSISELNAIKSWKYYPVLIGNDWADIIARETGMKKKDIAVLLKEKGKQFETNVIPNVRLLLQFIGTDIIRTIDPNWHVNKLKEFILSEYVESDKTVVIDDVRFPNELDMVREELGGTAIYVMRPTEFERDSHASENSINWKMFKKNNIFINGETLTATQKNWDIWYNQRRLSERSYPMFANWSRLVLTGDCDKFFDNTNPQNIRFAQEILNGDYIVENGTMYFRSDDKNLIADLHEFIYGKMEKGFPHGIFIENPFIIENLKSY